MKKFHVVALAAAIYLFPGVAIAETVGVLEPTVTVDATRYEKAVTKLYRSFLKLGKDHCRAVNRELHVKSKPVVTRSDAAIDLIEAPNGLLYHGVLQGRIACIRK